MMALPFHDGSVDVVTTGYGLRNVPTLADALDEIAPRPRARRPAAVARLQPAAITALVRAVYLAYLTVVGSALGWACTATPTPIATSRNRSDGIPARTASPICCERVDSTTSASFRCSADS